MNHADDMSERQQGPWQTMVRLSAAILHRDFGSRARQEALSRAKIYKLEKNERASQFWYDVAKMLKALTSDSLN
jgi:hypothetical protein